MTQIFMTGVSSFTGYHFAKKLAEQGFKVFGALTREIDSYTGIRKKRISKLNGLIEIETSCNFGSEKFINAISKVKPNYFLFHHAEVGNYKSETFDVNSSIQKNIFNLKEVFQELQKPNFNSIIFTRSIFEKDLGFTDNNIDITKYGLSKRLTYDLAVSNIPKSLNYKSFVICNPIGLFEEKKFSNYLINKWKNKETAHLESPNLIRDFIPISLLSDEYVKFMTDDRSIVIPSFLKISNLEFARKLSVIVNLYKGVNTLISGSYEKINDLEPQIRVGKDQLNFENSNSEEDFWINYLEYLWNEEF